MFGAGSGRTFVDGDKNGSVFTIGKSDPSVDVKLAHMVIRGGSSENGGGITNSGRLTIEDLIITVNEATGSGGGVYNKDGTMVMNSGYIRGNKAAQGGGAYNHLGVMDMYGGEMTGNKALGLSTTDPLGEGGGVWNNYIFNNHAGNMHDNKPDDVHNQEVSTESLLTQSTTS